MNLLLTNQQRLPLMYRKKYPLRRRAMDPQFASRNNQETQTAVFPGSKYPDNLQPVLNLEEREEKLRNFAQGH